MKILRFGKAGKNVCIGVDSRTGEWYRISDAVRPYLAKFEEGADVDIKFEGPQDAKVLTHINTSTGIGNSAELMHLVSPTPTPAVVSKSVTTTQPKSNWGDKSPEVQDSIKRQAIMHATSRALIALQGQINVQNIEEVSSNLYKHFQNLVG